MSAMTYDPKLQKAATAAVLSPHLPSDQLQTALEILADYRLDTPSATIGYVTAITRRFTLPDGLRKQLCLELHAQLQARSGKGRTVPAAGAAAPVQRLATPPAPNRAAAPVLPSTIQVFLGLAEAFTLRAREFGPAVSEDLRTALDEMLASAPEHGQALAGWPDLVDTDALNRLTKAELSSLFHTLYLAVCDALGPVEADALLQKAVAEAGRNSAVGEFSLRELL